MHPRPIPQEPGALIISRPMSILPSLIEHRCTVWAGGLASSHTFVLPLHTPPPAPKQLFEHLRQNNAAWQPVKHLA